MDIIIMNFMSVTKNLLFGLIERFYFDKNTLFLLKK